MTKLATLLGTSLFAASGLIIPMAAMARPQTSELDPERSLSSSAMPSQKMAIYRDCIRSHDNVNGADFKDVNKFCSCVADQSIQGDTTFSNCASGGSSGGGGGTFGMISEVAPSVIMGVVQGLASNSGKSGGLLSKNGGLLDGLGGLLGGGLLGGSSNSGSNGGGGIKDILKGR
jgi:hypothetical protein